MNEELLKIKEQIEFDNFRYELGLNDTQKKYISDNAEEFARIFCDHSKVDDLTDYIEELENERDDLRRDKESLEEKIEKLSTNTKQE